MDQRLKRLLIYYAVSAFCATALISGAIISDRYITSLSNTLNQFQTLKINSVKMKTATKDMDKLSVNVGSLIPPHYQTEEMEGAILTTVDAIKTRIKGADINLSNLEKKENEVSLPIIITGAMGEYASFINDIGYLQSLASPFMFISSISISKSPDEKKSAVLFEIKGTLKMRSFGTGGKA
jgi:hypothetical protein